MELQVSIMDLLFVNIYTPYIILSTDLLPMLGILTAFPNVLSLKRTRVVTQPNVEHAVILRTHHMEKNE